MRMSGLPLLIKLCHRRTGGGRGRRSLATPFQFLCTPLIIVIEIELSPNCSVYYAFKSGWISLPSHPPSHTLSFTRDIMRDGTPEALSSIVISSCLVCVFVFVSVSLRVVVSNNFGYRTTSIVHQKKQTTIVINCTHPRWSQGLKGFQNPCKNHIYLTYWSKTIMTNGPEIFMDHQCCY